MRLEGGWELGDCSEIRGLPEGTKITAYVPAEGEIGLDVRVQLGAFTFPVSLARVPQRDEPQASNNVSILWRQPGNGVHTDIWADDGLVFAPRLDGPIEILDAESGRIVGTASVAGAAGGDRLVALDVKAHGGMLYVATVSNGLVVFDISQPATPQLIGQYRVFVERGSPENFTNVHNIFLSPDGNFVYVINHSGLEQRRFRVSAPETDLRIIDVSNPAAPTEAGRFTVDTRAGIVHDVNVLEHEGRLIAFLNYMRAGLWVLDVTDPASVTAIGSVEWDDIISHSGWPFALGDRLYYAHAEEGYDRHLTILDVTELDDPRVVSRFSTREGLSVHNVQVVDGIAYVSYYIDGLRVVDLRDPGNPKEVGHFDTVSAEDERDIFQGAWGVRVLDRTIYISDMETGTYAFRVRQE